MNVTNLVYGKNDTPNIVSIEINDDMAELFLEKDNELYVAHVPNEYWILTHEYLGSDWVKLKGDLHYKYAKKFKSSRAFFSVKNKLKAQDKDFFCISDNKESFMVKNGFTYFKGMRPKDVSVLSFDIETTSLDHDASAKILLISNTFRNGDHLERKLFAYNDYTNEGEMIVDWCRWVCEKDPSVMLGHNIFSYDFPYIQFIADKYNVKLNLGRDGSSIKFFPFESKKRIDGSRDQAYHRLRIYGRECIDTMFLAINYDIAAKKYESYGLKNIIAQEGLEVKDRQFYDASQIRNNYTNPIEWEKIKQYALHDADDALALYDLMIPAYFYINQSIPKSFQSINETASGSQLNSMMIRSYLQDGHSLPKADPAEKYEGAISFGNPGIWRNAFKVDVASLYPSIMIEYEVYNRNKDPRGNMLEIVKIFTAERLKNKKLAEDTGDKYYDDLQNAQKIIINSFYGFLGAEGLLFNSFADAAFVTEKGREILQKSVAWATGVELIKVPKKKKKDGQETFEWTIGPEVCKGRGFSLVNCDTDSIMFCYPDFIKMDEEHRKELLAELNSLFPQRIRFADDGYFETAIIFKAKNYVLYGWNKKKQKMELKIKGSAFKDAKKEKAMKQFLYDIIDTIIKGNNNYKEIYDNYVKEAMNVKDITRWASKKTISSKVLTSERLNESKVRDAINGEEFVEGDKVWVYYKPDESLALVDNFDGVYDRLKMVERVYNTAKVLNTVIPKETFPNYTLKRNQDLLKELVNETK